MTARTVAVYAAIVGGVALLGKMVVMAIQGGPEPDTSVPENLAFFAGMIGLIVTAAAAGAFLARRRATGWRVLAGIVAVVVVGLVLGLGQSLLTSLPGDSWWQEESIFGILGLVSLAGAFALTRRGARLSA